MCRAGPPGLHRLVAPPVLLVVGVLAALAVLAGCSSAVPGRAVAAPVPAVDLARIHEYVDQLNAAGEAGPAAQLAYFSATQDPDSPPPRPGCLGRVTVRTQLVDRTLRPDPDFVAARRQGPPGRPVGAVYVAAAQVSAAQDGVTVREEVGSKHLLIRDGRVYGYSPCPG